MKTIKYVSLTFSMCCIIVPMMVLVFALSVVADFFRFIGVQHLHYYFHYLWIGVSEVAIGSFKFNDSQMGHFTLDYFKGVVHDTPYIVNFYDANYKNLESKTCKAHCKICAVDRAYTNDAAGYVYVETEEI